MVYSRDEVGEGLARELYLSAELDPTRIYGAPRVAAAALGQSCLHAVRPSELPGPALIQRDGARWIIHVRERLTPQQLNHAVAHELGEWLLRCRGYDEPDVEDLSSRVAAAICVPRPAFMLVHAQIGDDVAGLSRRFLVSESLMALRVAECIGYPTALLTENVVVTRGRVWQWPTGRREWTELVARVKAHETELTLRTLSDAKGRFVLRAR